MAEPDFLNHNINRLLHDKAEWIADLLRRSASEAARSEFSGAEGKIFGALRGRELTVSEIARLRGISRQAVHRTVSGLVERGYLELKLAEGSQRDKVVVITPAGQKLRSTVGEQLEAIEGEIAQTIGRERLEMLREILLEDWSANIEQK
jgi:DNA-binding MarR family transcriptional regulator